MAKAKPISKLTNWLFSRKAAPFWLVLIFDCMVVFLSAFVVYLLNNGLLFTMAHLWEVCYTIAIYLVFYIISFSLLHTYTGVIRYSSFVDLGRMASAILLAVFLSGAFKYIWANDNLYPIRMREIVIWSAVALLVIWLSRIVVKYCYDSIFTTSGGTPIFIYGVKQGGIALAKSIRNQKPSKFVLKGFVTDDADLKSHSLMGVKVYHSSEDLPSIMKSKGAEALLVSPLASQSVRTNKSLTSDLIRANIRLYMMPAEKEWVPGENLTPNQLQKVRIEDLLPREKIHVDMERIGEMFKGKSIMITGAAGSIGAEIVKQLTALNPAKLILIDQAETPLHDLKLELKNLSPNIKQYLILADVTNHDRMEEIFSVYRPDYIFHAAAYKHVPMMEENPSESIHNNVLGTRILADLSVKYKACKFVMISTDKAVNPTNVMGCSKRICEIYVQSLDKAIKEGKVDGVTQFITTRFGNVLGSNGSVIPLFREQIRQGKPVTVTHPEMTRYFMLIPEAGKLVMEAGAMGNGGEIYVFDMGDPVKIVDLARNMIRLSGADVDIKFIGLRDGEKLYEELLTDEEITKPTHNPKIRVAKVREYDYDEVSRMIDEMTATLVNDDELTIVRRMKAMVPEYKSNHSRFEELDQ